MEARASRARHAHRKPAIRAGADFTPSGEKLKSHGVDFHASQLLSHVLSCLVAGFEFELACEIEEAGKFDDVVLFYEKRGRRLCRLVQVKHRDARSRRNAVTLDELLSRNALGLPPYLESYVEDIAHETKRFEATNRCEIEDLVLLTNIDLERGVRERFETVQDSVFERETVCRLRLDEENVNGDLVERLTRKVRTREPVSVERVVDFLSRLKFRVGCSDGGRLERENKAKVERCLSKYGLCVKNVDFVYEILLSHVCRFHASPELVMIDRDVCIGWLEYANGCSDNVLSKYDIVNTNRVRGRCLRFETNSLASIDFDRYTTVLFLKSLTDSDITLSKLLSVFESRHKRCCLVTDEQLVYSKRSIEDDVLSTNIDFLVVECKSTTGRPDALFETVDSVAMKLDTAKIIIVSDRPDRIDHGYAVVEDDTKLTDLDVESRRSLANSTVVFQGQEVAFSSVDVSPVESHVRGTILSDLYRGRLEVSKRSVDAKSGEMEYFVERRVVLAGRVSRGLFERESLLFAIGNVDGERFRRIVDGLPGGSVGGRFVRLPAENTKQAFDELCEKHPSETVLWLFFYNGEFYLKKCSKANDYDGYVDKNVERIDAHRLGSVEDDHVLLIGEPGTGKSNLLSRLALRSVREQPDVWVVKIDLNSYTDYFETMRTECREFSNGDSVLRFLTHAQNFHSTFAGLLFRSYFESATKLTVLIDGFDEISPRYRATATRLVKYLKGVRGIRLWVTSRPQESDHLETQLSLWPRRLVAFDPNDRRTFFVKFWHVEGPGRERAMVFIDRLTKIAGESLCSVDASITGVPLQCRMLAEMFRDRFDEFYGSDGVDTGLPDALDVVEMYDGFVDGMFRRSFVEKRGIDATKKCNRRTIENERRMYVERFKRLALSVVFGREACSILDEGNVEEYADEVDEGGEDIGLVRLIDDGDPVFVHRTFAEYFAALWFFDRLRDGPDARLVEVFARVAFGGEHETVRRFFDRLAARCAVHRHALNDDRRSLEAALVDRRAIESLDEFGRTPLHLSAASSRGAGEADSALALLIERGADTTVEDRLFGWKPIRYRYESTRNWAEIERLLAGNEKDGSLDFVKDGFETALSDGRAAIVRYCLDHYKNDVRKAWRGDRFKLHTAARRGHAELCELLVERGSKVDAKDRARKTPLGYACEEYHVDVFKCLRRRGADLRKVDRATLLRYAFYREDVDVIGRFVDDDGFGSDAWAAAPTLLHAALVSDKVNVVEFLVRHGADVDGRDDDRMTPLHVAAIERGVDESRTLLDRGASVDATDSRGRTPLMHAAKRPNGRPIVELLLSRGADPSRRDAADRTIVHHVARRGPVETLRYFLDRDTDVDAADGDGSTPLHLAAERGDLRVVACLVEAGADVAAVDGRSRSTLHRAASGGSCDVVEYLIAAGVGVDARDERGVAPLHLAVRGGRFDLFGCLVDGGAAVDVADRRSRTMLHHAAAAGSVEIVEYLIAAGLDVDAVDADGSTPLQLAVEGEHFDVFERLFEAGAAVGDADGRLEKQLFSMLLRAVSGGGLETVRCLIAAGVDVNASDVYGSTPLHLAARRGHRGVFECLVDAGARVDVADRHVRSTLHHAASAGSLAVVERLIAAGLDVDAADVYGSTPLQLAAEAGHPDVFGRLVDAGASVRVSDRRLRSMLHLAASGGSPEIVGHLVGVDADVDATDLRGSTPLQLAAKRGRFDVFRRLVDAGASVDVVDGRRRSLLHHAASAGGAEIVEYLIDAGADVEATDADGSTPLKFAACGGHVDAFRRLVDAGARIDVVDERLRSMLHHAASGGCLEIVRHLIAAGLDVEAVDVCGLTPLQLAARRGRFDAFECLYDGGADVAGADRRLRSTLLHAASGGGLEIVKFLIATGIDVNAADVYGLTPLQLAAEAGRFDVFKYLRDRGAKVHVRDKQARSMLHHAATGGSLGIVRLLVEAGVRVDAADVHGLTPSHMAARGGHYAAFEYLFARAPKIRGFSRPSFDARVKDKRLRSTLHHAAFGGSLEIVRFLIETGVGVNAASKNGCTPLQLAVERGHFDVFKCLVDNGANVHARDGRSRSMLHRAASGGRLEFVKYLIGAGVDVDAVDENGRTPLQLAADRGYFEVFECLVDAGTTFDAREERLRLTTGHCPASGGRSKIVNYLIDDCADELARAGEKGDSSSCTFNYSDRHCCTIQ